MQQVFHFVASFWAKIHEILPQDENTRLFFHFMAIRAVKSSLACFRQRPAGGMAVRGRVSGRGPRRRNGAPGNPRLVGCRRRGKDSPEGAYRSAGPWTEAGTAAKGRDAPGRKQGPRRKDGKVKEKVGWRGGKPAPGEAGKSSLRETTPETRHDKVHID